MPAAAASALLFFFFFVSLLACWQKVVKLLVKPKYCCVTITGERGSGKTERAIQAADYVRERHHFDAVHWADCNDVVEAEASLSCPTPPPFAEFPGAVDWSGDSGPDPCRLVSVTFTERGMCTYVPVSFEIFAASCLTALLLSCMLRYLLLPFRHRVFGPGLGLEGVVAEMSADNHGGLYGVLVHHDKQQEPHE